MSIPYWQFDLLSLKLQVCSLFCLSRMEFVRWRTVVPREGKGLTAEEAIGSSHSEKTINVLLCITCLQTTAEEEKEKDRKRAATSWQTKDHWSKKDCQVRAKIIWCAFAWNIALGYINSHLKVSDTCPLSYGLMNANILRISHIKDEDMRWSESASPFSMTLDLEPLH